LLRRCDTFLGNAGETRADAIRAAASASGSEYRWISADDENDGVRRRLIVIAMIRTARPVDVEIISDDVFIAGTARSARATE